MTTDEAPAWGGHLKGTTEYRRILAGLFFAGFATFAQLYSPQAALPQIAAEFGVGAAGSALAVSAATVGLAVGVIPWSVVADHAGRVRSMAIAVIAASILGLLVPFAPTFPLFLTGRFFEGMMLGGVPAIAIAYLSEEIHQSHATRAAGTYIAGTSVGGLLGRVVTGPVAELTSWRGGVLAVAVLCSAAAGLFIWLAPAARGFVARRDRPGGVRKLSLRQRLAANLRSPRQFALYAQAFLLMGGFVALYNYLGFRLALAPFSMPPAFISLVFVAYLAGTWSSAQAGVLAGRVGRRPVLLVSIAVMVAGVLLTLVPVTIPVLVGLVLATIGFFAAHSIASGWTAAEASVGRAQASSLYNLSYYAGSSLFGFLGGVFFDAGGWSATAAMIATLAVVAGALALFVLRPGTGRGTGTPSPL
ncbi:MFS transporter [soil metagenome]